MTAYHDTQYLDLVRHALKHGDRKPNRTGTDTIATFGYQMRFDLSDGTIPLLTTKKMFTRGVIHEILWYLQGADNIKYLADNNVHIWDEWARPDGSLGPVYGFQWRKWPSYELYGRAKNEDPDTYVLGSGIDQIAQLIHKLKTNPNDRRMIVSAWNVGQIDEMALPPCHYAFQCYARPLSSSERARMFLQRTGAYPDDLICTPQEDHEQLFDQVLVPRHELSMLLNQRSCDIALGVPFNIVQYSILLRMIAHVVNMTPGTFIWNGGDVHIYENHVEGLNTQLERAPYPSPKLTFSRDVTSIDDYKFEDFIIEGYQSHEKIAFDVAV